MHLSSGWGAYIGGEGLEDTTVAKVAASGGFVYVVGTTDSRGLFPHSLFNGGRTDNTGVTDGFVAKYTAEGSLVWGRYFGGELNDKLNDVAVDGSGNVYVVGTAYGYSPARHYAFGPASGDGGDVGVSGYAGGASDAVVGKLSADGEYKWITFAGGLSDDTGAGIAVAGSLICVVGDTNSSEGWVYNKDELAYGQTWHSTTTAGFVAAIDASSGERKWSDYVSGVGEDHATAIAGNDGNLFITGSTTSQDLDEWPLNDFGARSWSGTAADAYLLHLDPSKGVRMGFTYLSANGAGAAMGTAVALDPSANPVVVGVTPGALQWNESPAASSADNVFVAKFQNALSLAYWGITVDGDAAIDVNDVAVANDGSILLGGSTSASSFTVLTVDAVNAPITRGNTLGGTDGYLLRLDGAGAPVAVRYVGGEGQDTVGGVAIDGANWYASGTTVSSEVADITMGVRQGSSDAFLLSTGLLDTNAPTVEIRPGAINMTTQGNYQFTVVYDGGATAITQYPHSLVLGTGKSAVIADVSATTVMGSKLQVTYGFNMPLKGWRHGQKFPVRIDPGTVRDASNVNDRLAVATIVTDLKAPKAAIYAGAINGGPGAVSGTPRTVRVTYDGTFSGMGQIPMTLYLTNDTDTLTATRQSVTVAKGKTIAVYQVAGDITGAYQLKIGAGAFSDAAGNASTRDYLKKITVKTVATSAAPLYGPVVQPADTFATQSLLANEGSLLA